MSATSPEPAPQQTPCLLGLVAPPRDQTGCPQGCLPSTQLPHHCPHWESRELPVGPCLLQPLGCALPRFRTPSRGCWEVIPAGDYIAPLLSPLSSLGPYTQVGPGHLAHPQSLLGEAPRHPRPGRRVGRARAGFQNWLEVPRPGPHTKGPQWLCGQDLDTV